jgi:hypothetical protein
MARRSGAVHVVTTTRHYKGKVYETHLLRRSYRDGAAVRNETVGNLSHLPRPLIAWIRRALRGEAVLPAEAIEVVRSVAHGDAQAVLAAMDRLGFARPGTSRRAASCSTT